MSMMYFIIAERPNSVLLQHRPAFEQLACNELTTHFRFSDRAMKLITSTGSTWEATPKLVPLLDDAIRAASSWIDFCFVELRNREGEVEVARRLIAQKPETFSVTNLKPDMRFRFLGDNKEIGPIR